MRFAANIRELEEHRTVVRKELQIVEDLIDDLQQWERDSLVLSSDGRRSLLDAVSKLQGLQESISYRLDFLRETADIMRELTTREENNAREADGLLSQVSSLGIKE